MNALNRRPGPGEIPEYYRTYLDYIPEGDLLDRLGRQLDVTLAVASELDPDHRYAPGKWSVKEVLVHLADTERVMGYRALRFARGDDTPLPGFEQDDYVVSGELAHRSLDDVAAELRGLRVATVALYQGMAPDTLDRVGTANAVPLTPRAMAWIIAGHELHHRTLLDERYR